MLQGVSFSYIVTVPLDSGDIVGIVYVWIGNSVHPDDALLAQEIANDMYNVSDRFTPFVGLARRVRIRIGLLHYSSDQRRK